VRAYFNNHYGAKAVANALQLKEMLGETLSAEQQRTLKDVTNYLHQHTNDISTSKAYRQGI
jgi:hypothetical protein